MTLEQHTALDKQKVIKEAALRSGVSEGVMHACWDAAGEVIKAWATEGHSVPMPGLGSMRFTVRSKAVTDIVEEPENEGGGASPNPSKEGGMITTAEATTAAEMTRMEIGIKRV